MPFFVNEILYWGRLEAYLPFASHVQADLKSAVESCEDLQIRQTRSFPYVDCKSTATTVCVMSLRLADFQLLEGRLPACPKKNETSARLHLLFFHTKSMKKKFPVIAFTATR